MKNYSAQIGADIAGLQLQWLCPTTFKKWFVSAQSQAQTTVPDQKRIPKRSGRAPCQKSVGFGVKARLKPQFQTRKNSKEKRAHALSGVSGIWCESQAQTAVPDQKKTSKEKRAHALSGVSGIWCVWCWVLHVRSTCACPIDPVNPNKEILCWVAAILDKRPKWSLKRVNERSQRGSQTSSWWPKPVVHSP